MADLPVLTISSVNQATELIGDRLANEVRLQLHEMTSLLEAEAIKETTRPGRHGYVLTNPELLDCKSRAKVRLVREYDRLYQETMRQCDRVLLPLDNDIAALKVSIAMEDHEIPHAGPALTERNRGVQHCYYPEAQFSLHPSYEYGTTQQTRVPYQPAFATDQERAQASARDRRAQREWWKSNLAFLEKIRKILEDNRIQLERALKSELDHHLRRQSDLGVGYHGYEFRPLPAPAPVPPPAP
ncbi:hypothetical protein EJB05_10184 [Eragrostis curvula]|uniref:Uncharacterized protein n=1 Tax=Eragrostis curvula TaxID=38414 RepID=A0A5J9W6V0_9POAL|nr:hypothetical protein EJB05_10184 [Eragrostis curvula]